MSIASDLRIRYVFDPLCGWCYAASPAIAGLAERYGLALDMLPWGLFADDEPMRLSPTLAHHFWSNDERIARLTGLPFSQAYRDDVLGAHGSAVDSLPATRALTLVRETAPAREFAYLHQLQRARYVDGRDITRADVLADLAASLDIDAPEFATRVAHGRTLDNTTAARIGEARTLMTRIASNGVPALVVSIGRNEHVVHGAPLYRGAEILLSAVDSLVSNNI
ncbi:DsbA family protein [Trinickia fusca]|uniref:DSBA-like thioredoxin domain-containing protein n=1 Tax=Trinickia fusca TaxID=2419777 RepID=A0A494XSK2_9BURK|nr:DsbA family protein [Trinickia fusca]RKP50523.1 hypothetical protein D7S89_05300 [Trinickia fusca]